MDQMQATGDDQASMPVIEEIVLNFHFCYRIKLNSPPSGIKSGSTAT